jgi:Tfp pilus assembly protein PilO
VSQVPSVEEIPQSTAGRNRFAELIGSRRSKMFGPAELVALFCSCFVLFLVLLSYLYFYLPGRSHYSSLLSDRDRTKTNLEKLKSIADTGQTTQATVQKIATSLDTFESNTLAREDSGRLALYVELNQMILKHNLRNTSGPTYTAVDPAGTKATPGKAVNSKWQSYYPGLAVMVTVEGPYENVRNFIQDIERSKQFLIINEVELQEATENNLPVSAEGSASGGKASLVSLQLGMATYFRRGTDGTVATGQE